MYHILAGAQARESSRPVRVVPSTSRIAGEKNRLYYGDNLAVLRGTDAVGRPNIPSESVDLIYPDPPFNSRQDYNVLFAEKDGNRSAAQITAFKDTWKWNEEAARNSLRLMRSYAHPTNP